jgi:Histidine kinase-, DNA gyrase B-, and HSP90-like ATPase
MGRPVDGTEIDTVQVEIDYQILQHFSEHLYASPNKAVEELVTNGYDALAHTVQVYLPGTAANSCLLVWDDGESMDVGGLKQLWWIARSPKENINAERVAVSADGLTTRRMIGKFGIGKLASYAVGETVAHVCRREDVFLLVSVDYRDAPSIEDQQNGEQGFPTPVLSLEESKARDFVTSLFTSVPDGFEEMWSKTRWTLAIVDDLRPEVTLTQGRLAWVLGNGMPLRPDFTVYVNGTAVTPKLEKDAVLTLDLAATELQSAINAQWTSAVKDLDVEGEIAFGTDAAGAAVVVCPALGEVRAELRIFDRSLRTGRAANHGRSEGFFVMVRDRLLNPDDGQFLLHDPSFATFYRMQALIWADGLDAELLADRERLRESSAATAELRVLQTGIYLAARGVVDKRDAEHAAEALPVTILPIDSREFFRQPLAALSMRRGGDQERLADPGAATIDVQPLTEGERLTTLDVASDTFIVNATHPLFAAVRSRVGDKKAGQETLRLVELFAISDALLEGHLLDVGVDSDTIDQVMAWRDGQLRSLAAGYSGAPDKIVAELWDASYVGGTRFERSLAQILALMGFTAEPDGKSGMKDVLVVAPIGVEQYRFTVEGKGSKNQVANDAAEVSGASAHAKAADAEFAVIVAREFAGFGNNPATESAAVLNECATSTPPVSIVTVGTLAALYGAFRQYHYPLNLSKPILSTIESPETKLAAVHHLSHPVEQFDYPELLTTIWELQKGSASGSWVSLMQVQQTRDDWKDMTDEGFSTVMYGIESMARGLIAIGSKRWAVNLRAAPDTVAACIADAVGATT